MAAGEGRRLRPITERWPKPVLPIDGRPVVVTLVHELAAAGCGPIVVVTGHLAEQVEALLEPLPYDLRFVRQPPGLGSADAVARAEATPPYVVTAADTVYAAGDLARFAADGARRSTARSRSTVTSGRRSWLLGARVAAYLDPLPGSSAVRAGPRFPQCGRGRRGGVCYPGRAHPRPHLTRRPGARELPVPAMSDAYDLFREGQDGFGAG